MRNFHATFRTVLVVVVALAMLAEADAATYYVRVSGSDSNDGLTPASALATIEQAATIVQAGDTVYVGAGTYEDKAEPEADGTAANPIRFIADTSGAMTGDAGDVIFSDNESFKLEEVDYYHIFGFIFDGKDKMVKFKECVGGLVQDCEFRNGKETITIEKASATILNCYFHDNDGECVKVKDKVSTMTLRSCTMVNSKKGIKVDKAAQITIEDTTITDCEDKAIEFKADDGTGIFRRLVIQRNKMGMKLDGKSVIVVENCLITDSEEEGIESKEDDYIYADQVTISHCTIVRNDDGGIKSKADTIRNCVIAYNLKFGIKGDEEATSDYNLLYANAGGVKNYDHDITPGENDILEDPMFESLSGGNYRLKSISPGIDAGINLLSSDIEGVLRPGGSGPDLGAYEIGPKIFYVRTSGDDANDGNHPDHAFRTVGRAAEVATSGSEVYVGAGTYAENVQLRNPATNHWTIRFIADADGAQTGDAGAVIVTPAGSGTLAWSLKEAHYNSIEGFRISGSGLSDANGVNVEDCNGVTIKNCEFDNLLQGVYATNSGVVLDTCIIRDTTERSVYSSAGVLYIIDSWFVDNYEGPVTNGDFLFRAKRMDVNDSQQFAVRLNRPVSLLSSGQTADPFGILSADPTLILQNPQTEQAAFIDCSMDGNTHGLSLKGYQTFAEVVLAQTTVTNTVNWSLSLEDCDLSFETSTWGLWPVGDSGSGIYADNCSLAVRDVVFPEFANGYALYSVLGTLTVENSTLSNNTYGVWLEQCTATVTKSILAGNTQDSIHATKGDLTVSNSALSGSGYGIWADTAVSVVIDTCTLSGNTAGLYSDQNTSLSASNSTFTGNTLWGATVTPKTAGGLSVTFSACTFHSNAGGLALVNAVDGQVSLQSNTMLRDNTSAGLHFDNCTLTVNDQAGGANWRTLRNGHGISSNHSTLTLSNVTVEESSSFGVLCEDSVVSLAGCTVTGDYGIQADSANDSLSVDTSRFDASSHAGWGLARYGGAVDVKNSIFNGYLGGVYLSTAGSDSATVSNITIANAGSHGVYVAQGDATVRNTIIAGNNATDEGIYNGSGQLTHSHNLVHGFTTPYSGTTADSSEVQSTPRFVDAAGGDLHLAAGSPAINAGLDLGLSLPTDMEGNTRPSFRVFEIGAYEYMNANGSYRILRWREIE